MSHDDRDPYDQEGRSPRWRAVGCLLGLTLGFVFWGEVIIRVGAALQGMR